MMRFVVSLLLGVCGFLLSGQAGFAQSIVGQDETIVKSTSGNFEIDGGALSQNNLFHSFAQFGLEKNQTVTFFANPQIVNIFARVTGGSPSLLDGQVAINGGNMPSFYLMNPAGVIFGPNFQFPTGLPLTATTANGLAFGSQWWSATGVNNYAALAKDPTAFGFTTAPPAAIINRWASGNTPLTLVAGTVISPADATATAGNITIAAVPGDRLVQITSTGNLLGLEIRPFAVGESRPNAGLNPVPSLAQLITGPGPNGGTIGDATGLRVNPDGTVLLSGASLNVGDVYTGNLTANGVLIGAPTGNVTVSTIEAQDTGVQVIAGKHFQATGARLYEGILNGSLPNSGERASIAVLKSKVLQATASNILIEHDGGSILSHTTAFEGLRASGNAIFIVGGMTARPMSIPLAASGTVNAIVVQSSSGTVGGLSIAYANQTFGQVGPIPGTILTTTMSNQKLTAESPIESPAEPPMVNDRTQAHRHCAATPSSGAKRTIVAMRSATSAEVSGNCATDGDDAAILKILE
jgi:filamentous hemagglutinin family protein